MHMRSFRDSLWIIKYQRLIQIRPKFAENIQRSYSQQAQSHKDIIATLAALEKLKAYQLEFTFDFARSNVDVLLVVAACFC